MNFLAPLFLLGGLAIAAPIVYHLVRRTTRERLKFSSLMFLLPSPPRMSKRHRLEHWLLLALRCAALLLLALGFSRPFFRQAPIVDPSAAEPRRVVVLVDTSASMRRAGLWAGAQAKAAEILREAGPADQVALYAFDRRAQPLLTFEEWNRAAPGDRAPLANARLAAAQPGWAGTHLGQALITAAEALAEDEGKSAPGPRQIVLIGDLQAGSRLDTLQSYEWPKGVEVIVEPVKPTSTGNAGVQLVADAADTTRSVDAPVRVRVTNAAESTNERFTLAWSRRGADGAQETAGTPIDAYVPPGQSRVFSLLPPKGVTEPERIVLNGDDEAFDNTVHVIPPVQQRASVLWIGPDVAEDPKQPLFFLRRAYVETPRVAVSTVAVRASVAVPSADLAAANLVFVAEPLPDAVAADVRRAVEAGKTAVVVARTPALAATLGALAGAPGSAPPMAEGRVATYAMLAEIDFQHPLFAPFADPRFSDFTKIHVWKYRKLDAASLPGARIVAKFDNGDPAVLEIPVGRGRVFVLATGWQPEDSQLAVSSKFVPLMWSLLELGGGVAAVTTQYAVGDPIAVAGAAASAGAVAPGIYEIAAADGRTQRYAVNLDANESRTTALSPDELEQMGLPVAKAKPAAAAGETTTLLQGVEAENRQKLWRWFIAATLLVLLVESALAGWTARRAALQTQEVAS